MIVDLVTLKLARTLPWRYEDVHRLLGYFAAVDASPECAAEWLRFVARGEITLDAALRAAQLGATPNHADK